MHSAFLQDTMRLICSVKKSDLGVSRHRFSVSRHSLCLLFLPSFALRLKDSISHLGIPLMPLLLFLKILPPNQIYQLALALLLFSSCVKSCSLSCPLDSPFFFFFPTFCAHSRASLPVRRGFSERFPRSVSLSPSFLPALNDFSLLCDCSVCPASLSRAFSSDFSGSFFPPVAPLPLLLRHCSVHAASEPVTDESACLSLCVLTRAVLRPPLFVCCRPAASRTARNGRLHAVRYS